MRPFSVLLLIIPILAVSLLLGCSKEEPQKEKTEEFTPPEDGKITPSQAEAYVKACLALTQALKDHEKTVREFTAKRKLNSDLTELADSSFMASHPEVAVEWDDLNKKWREREEQAYKEAGLTEEEFNWIGGALTDTLLNKEIQKEVAQKISTGAEGTE